MNKLLLDLKNCFGIGELKHEFDFTDSNTYLIYAPNGTMKTSFAKTFESISKNNTPEDLVYGRKTTYDVLADENPINPSSILVVNAEDGAFDATNKISSFIASKDLKSRYESVYEEVNNAKSELLKKLKSISKSNDCEGEYVGAFRKTANDNFLEVLKNHVGQLTGESKKISFKYNDVFDNKGNVKKFLSRNQALLNDYIDNYNHIISSSRLFKSTEGNNFGTYQAGEILKSIEDNSYFDAGHTFVLEDGMVIKNFTELEALYNEELEKIFADEKLKKSFEKFDKAIGANGELRLFKKAIEEDKSIVIELKDYEAFKQKTWTSYLSEIKEDATAVTELYESKKVELEQIINEAKKELSLWNKIITKFNSRFYVPFTVSLGNHQDIILKQETANLVFHYQDKNEPVVKQTRENLLKILSKGEQRAYFILQFLFEIESRSVLNQDNLLIFDDIADSFDYKNKYAIIEYIRDLHLSDKFKLIILTHNFDFYRTLSSRLELKEKTLMATKNDQRVIELKPGLYTGAIFKDFISKANEPKIFLSLIGFVRNLIEYSDSSKSDDYQLLTCCLHNNALSKSTTVRNVKEVLSSRISKLKTLSINFNEETSIHEFLFSIADEISHEEDINEVLLENKIVLAMASRVKTELYLLKKLPDTDLHEIRFNQMRALSSLYKTTFPESDNLETIDRVNLMTPENIHVNAFMYEPLIDMSVVHLIDLYNKSKDLN